MDFRRADDHHYFTELCNRYWRPLFDYAAGLMADDDAAADVVQEVFTWLWTHLPDLHIESSIKSYLYTAVRREALRAMRRSDRFDDLAGKLADHYEEGVDYTSQSLEYQELSGLLAKYVDELPARMRDVYRKSYEEGMSHRDIAAELGISEGSSKTILNRAITILRSKLTPFLSLLIALVNIR